MNVRAMRTTPRRRKTLSVLLVACLVAAIAWHFHTGASRSAPGRAFALTALRPKHIVGAIAALVLVLNNGDFRLIPNVVGSAPSSSAAIAAASLFIYAYEKLIRALLYVLGLAKFPSVLAAMLSLFAILRVVEKVQSRAAGEKLADLLTPGVNFLGKWMGLFLAPPLAGLDSAILALPLYGPRVWMNTLTLLLVGWKTTCLASAQVATQLAPEVTAKEEEKKPAAAMASKGGGKSPVISPEDALRRVWILVTAVGYLGVSMGPGSLTRPFGMLCELGTTVTAFMSAKLLPSSVQSVLHPLVVCALMANLSARYAGPAAPFLGGNGVGDLLVGWLPAAMTGLGVRMFATTKLWLDRPADCWCVVVSCFFSGLFSVIFMLIVGVSPLSPLGVPAPLSLPLLNRSVMSALGIEGSLAIGPECDPKLAVASILITGCIGASLGKMLLSSVKTVNTASPLVRGIAMGCSAHSIGTAALIGDGDNDAAAISGAAMCLAGTAHTILLQMPGMVPVIRALAGV